MFFPEVTNIRSPTILVPVVSPTSCLIDPRYSTLGDITASGSGGTLLAEAGTAAAARLRAASEAAVRARIHAGTQRAAESCASGDARARRGGAIRAEDQHGPVRLDAAEHEDLRPHRADLARREVHDRDDERALELLARVVGDLRRRGLLPELGAEVDAQLPRGLARLGEVLDGDHAADAHVDRQ